MRWILILLVILTVTCAACRRSAPPVSPEAVDREGFDAQVFIGLASYYGAEFAGEKTASGDTFDPSKLTAAHRTLPFGTVVRVTNLENNRSVIATITDRGPEKPDRIIDVSFNAATQLMMLSSGVVKVRVEVVNEQ